MLLRPAQGLATEQGTSPAEKTYPHEEKGDARPHQAPVKAKSQGAQPRAPPLSSGHGGGPEKDGHSPEVTRCVSGRQSQPRSGPGLLPPCLRMFVREDEKGRGP